VRHLAIDRVDPQENPPPVLPFAAPADYIPAATSTMKHIEDALTKAANRIPELADDLTRASERVDRMLAALEGNGVSDKVVAAVARADETLASLEAAVRRFDRERVPEKTSKALDDLGVTVAKLDHVLDQLGGERGLISGIARTTDAFGQVGRGVSSSTRDLGEALDELRDAAEAIRVLAQDLDRDPDMLLKGRASGSR
jgi:hypothetical protein